MDLNLDTDLKLNTPQLDIAVDRDKAAAVGVEVDTLGRTLETLLGGRQVTRFKPDEVPLFGTKAQRPSDCLPQQNRAAGAALHRTGLTPSGQELAKALTGLNMLTEAEISGWVDRAYLPTE